MPTENLIGKRRPQLVGLLGLLVSLALLLSGCSGSSSYDPVDTSPPQVMISPETLEGWVSNGYGTDARGYDRMVILDVDSAAGYAAGHIPGAYNLDTGSDLQTARHNGVSSTVSQVPTAAMMDALIQRTGIDERTVVVLVGNGNLMNVGRAYFNFRYWGFPKERLRVLNGTKTATYLGAGFALSDTAPSLPAPSSYSVAQLQANTSLRASLEEMIKVAEGDDPLNVIADARSAGEYEGTDIRGGAAFGGHIRGAELQDWATLIDPENSTALLPKADLQAAMEAIGASEETTVYTYCQTSWRAAANFLALDAVLGWPAKIYDGAWIQWGQMARNDSGYSGALNVDSPWRTDTPARSELINYNKIVVPLDAAESFAPAANLINKEDKEICNDDPAEVENLDGLFPEPANVLISAEDLAGWLADSTAFNTATGYNNLVVLQVDASAKYDEGHIPNAFLLNSAATGDLSATRSDGVAPTISQVATKGQMDALIQRTGIDQDTVVVFATNANKMVLGRAYFNFRYWGFPKERLRVLNGTVSQFAADTSTDLATAAPEPVFSTYSVCYLPQKDSVDRFRASFEEMFEVAADHDPSTVVADARSQGEYEGYDIRGGVAFGGRIKGAAHQEWEELIKDGKLLPKEDLETAMTAIGAGPMTTVYTYCQTSWRAAANFLALDAVLGWPVKIYDGAWVQWGQMARNEPRYDGSLFPSSLWRTDTDVRSEAITYGKPHLGANSYAASADLINQQDAAAGGGTSGSGTGGSGSGGGSSAPLAPGYN